MTPSSEASATLLRICSAWESASPSASAAPEPASLLVCSSAAPAGWPAGSRTFPVIGSIRRLSWKLTGSSRSRSSSLPWFGMVWGPFLRYPRGRPALP
ncbi:hypothetical protein ACFFX0_12820 [Citricoccus parietis]|uniref:Secreted protein n=1 Tax=Citricoccus parietis TaxID=592307 RepID=A0ABV5FZD7_9MICC